MTTVALPPLDVLPTQHDLFDVAPTLPSWALDIPDELPHLVDPPPIPLSELIPPLEV